jgi:hypothetical protein
MLSEQQCLNVLATEGLELSAGENKMHFTHWRCFTVQLHNPLVRELAHASNGTGTDFPDGTLAIPAYLYIWRAIWRKLQVGTGKTLYSMPCSHGRLSLHNYPSYLLVANVLVSCNPCGGATLLLILWKSLRSSNAEHALPSQNPSTKRMPAYP